MSGPEHYREAERLLESCQITSADEHNAAIYPAVEDGQHTTGNALAAAQIHATLALAAATVECASDINPPQEFAGNGNYITQGTNAKAWQGVLG